MHRNPLHVGGGDFLSYPQSRHVLAARNTMETIENHKGHDILSSGKNFMVRIPERKGAGQTFLFFRSVEDARKYIDKKYK